MSKVDLNKKEKKNALLQTAFELFTDKGFAKTTISDISSKAGLAKGTFYLYFKDKYDLRSKVLRTNYFLLLISLQKNWLRTQNYCNLFLKIYLGEFSVLPLNNKLLMNPKNHVNSILIIVNQFKKVPSQIWKPNYYFLQYQSLQVPPAIAVSYTNSLFLQKSICRTCIVRFIIFYYLISTKMNTASKKETTEHALLCRFFFLYSFFLH